MEDATKFEGRYQLSIPLEGYTVAEWCPDQHAREPPTQVHLIVPVGRPVNHTLVIRLKSRRALDELVATLNKHGDSVWPR